MVKNQSSLRQRIVILCTSLVLLTSVVIQTASWWSTSRFNSKQITNTIDKAENVFEQYLKEKEKLLTTAANVLTADFGFKQAVTSNDSETIASVLSNHGQRINANLMMLTNLNGELISSSQSDLLTISQNNVQFNRQLKSLISANGRSQFVIINDLIYQLLASPVKAPRTVAYAIVGFEISHSEINELKKLTGLDISIYNNHQTLLLTSMDTPFSEQYLMNRPAPWLFWNRPAFDNRHFNPSTSSTNGISILLSADLSEIYREYDEVMSTIIIIASLILLIAMFISAVFARNLINPLTRLVSIANSFAQGKYRTLEITKNMSQEVSTLFNSFSEMGKQINAREKDILYQAQHDFLTDLYNRRTFRNLVEEMCVNKQPFILIAFSVTGLDSINDTLGIEMGDRCLKAVASRLSHNNIENTKSARLDGVLFSSLIPYDDYDDGESDIIKTFTETLAIPINVDDLTVQLKFRVGIAIHPEDGEDSDTIIRRVMIAHDAAKRENQIIRYYHKGEDEAHLEHLAIVESLKHALDIDDGQLYMNYQPKLNLSTNKVDKVESLIRWQHPELGFISPELFIAYAEQTGMIFQLTHWVINTVLKQLQNWQQNGIFIEAAINISAQDITHPDFFMILQSSAAKYGISSKYITLEVTERDLMQDEEQAIALLVELKNAGYTISVDDYGIGQSSLAKLKQLPVDELKIDKSFIMELNSSESDQIIVNSTITLGHRLGLSVVAEGLENKESLALLKAMDCDHIQGYFLSRPMTSEDFVHWFRNRNENLS